jgi:hypothetical protein
LEEKMGKPTSEGPETASPSEETTHESPPTVSERFRILVDRRLTHDEMIDAGRYDEEHNHARYYSNFPLPFWQEKEVVLVSFGREMRRSELDEELDSLGLERGDTCDLLAFGATYPEAQYQAKIVETGTSYDWIFFFCLHATGRKRALGTVPYVNHKFDADLHFLAVVKESVREVCRDIKEDSPRTPKSTDLTEGTRRRDGELMTDSRMIARTIEAIPEDKVPAELLQSMRYIQRRMDENIEPGVRFNLSGSFRAAFEKMVPLEPTEDWHFRAAAAFDRVDEDELRRKIEQRKENHGEPAPRKKKGFFARLLGR